MSKPEAPIGRRVAAVAAIMGLSFAGSYALAAWLETGRFPIADVATKGLAVGVANAAVMWAMTRTGRGRGTRRAGGRTDVDAASNES